MRLKLVRLQTGRVVVVWGPGKACDSVRVLKVSERDCRREVFEKTERLPIESVPRTKRLCAQSDGGRKGWCNY